MEHTEGKLEVGGVFRGNADPIPNCLLKDGRLVAKFENPMDAIRANAYWNTLEGFTNEEIENFQMNQRNKRKRIDKSERELKDKLTKTTNLLEIAINERDKARSVKDTLLESLKTILDPGCMEDIRLLIKEVEERE